MLLSSLSSLLLQSLLLLQGSHGITAFMLMPTRTTTTRERGATPNVAVVPVVALLRETVGRASLLHLSSSSEKGHGGEDSVDKNAENTPITVERVLKDNYPDFHKLLVSQNENIFNLLENDIGQSGYTIFAPNAQAFADLSDKQRMQIKDPRNGETTQKMGLYHIVSDAALSLTDLNREDWTVPKTPEGLPALKFRALVTMAGEVPIGRFKQTTKGSIFRSLINKKKTVRDKDGKPLTEVVVGPSGRILRSVKVGKAIIHECDGFASPNLLWRYFDQLRLPGL